MREKTIEQKLVQAVKAKGGIARSSCRRDFRGSRPPYPIAGWEMRLRGSQGPWQETTAAAGVKDTAFAGLGFLVSSWTMRARSAHSF